jgi:hypothetical protein
VYAPDGEFLTGQTDPDFTIVGGLATDRELLVVAQRRVDFRVVRLGLTVAITVVVIIAPGDLDALEVLREPVHVYSRDRADRPRFARPVEVRIRVLDVEEKAPIFGDEHPRNLAADNARRKAVECRSFLFDPVALRCLGSCRARYLTRRRRSGQA